MDRRAPRRSSCSGRSRRIRAPALPAGICLAHGNAMIRFTTALLSLSIFACSSMGQDVIPTVLKARLTVDPAAPDQLAGTDFIVTFDTGVGTDRRVALDHVWLLPNELSAEFQPLAMAFPDDFEAGSAMVPKLFFN